MFVQKRLDWWEMFRVGQNHISTVYIRYFWLGNHQIYGVYIRIYTVLANPRNVCLMCALRGEPLESEVRFLPL